MTSLYLTRHGATLRNQGRSLIVTVREKGNSKTTLLEVERHRLETIYLFGDVHVTSDALRSCLLDGITLSWFKRNGRFLARTTLQNARSADLRLEQYRLAVDPLGSLALARRILSAKMANSIEVLESIRSNHPEYELLRLNLTRMKDQLRTLPDILDRDALLGHEGTMARTYFAALGEAVREPFTFEGRRRRPPPDPVNSMLSFAYVLLGNRIAGLLEARGLDPALGFLHEVRPGRPSLALDLLEEFRAPIVDRFVLRVCNLRILQPEDFEADTEGEDGVRLTQGGLRSFFRAWGKALRTPVRVSDSAQAVPALDLLQRQVDRLAMSLRGKQSYEPFLHG